VARLCQQLTKDKLTCVKWRALHPICADSLFTELRPITQRRLKLG